MVDLAVEVPLARTRTVRRMRSTAGAGWIAAAALGVGVMVYGVADRMVPVSTASARLAVAQGVDDGGSREARVAAAGQMLHSPEFLRTVIRRLDATAAARLDDDVLVPDSLAARLFAALGPDGATAATAVEERRVAALGAALAVSRSAPETVSISLAADTPTAAATTLNAVLDTYVSLASTASGAGSARIVTPAVASEPRSGRALFGLSVLAGLAAAFATAAFMRRRSASDGHADIAPVPSAPPVVGAIPVDFRLPSRPGAGQRREALGGERFWAPGATGPRRCLAVIGVGGTEASREVARLAASAAEDKPAVMIDLTGDDALPPPANALGFGGLLSGEASFAEVIVRDPQLRFHVLSGRPDDLTMAPERFDTVIEALVHAYERVVIHLPPGDVDHLAGRAIAHLDGIVLATDRDACAPGVRSAFDRLTHATRRPVTVVATEARGAAFHVRPEIDPRLEAFAPAA